MPPFTLIQRHSIEDLFDGRFNLIERLSIWDITVDASGSIYR